MIVLDIVCCKKFRHQKSRRLFTSGLVISNKPINRFGDSLLEWSKLVIGQVFAQLCIRCRLLELPIGFGRVILDFSLNDYLIND